MKNHKLTYWQNNKEASDIEYWMAINDFEEESYHKLAIPLILDKIENDIRKLFEMNFKEYVSLFGESLARELKNDLDHIKKSTNIEEYRRNKIELDQSGIRIIRYIDDSYPANLKKREKLPPLVLYHKGTLLDFDNCVAIIGARNSSHYGRQKAREMAKNLAEGGYTIVAGLALGIDTEAHCGALDGGGNTIAVIPNIIKIVPSTNERLAEDISHHGALLSSGSSFTEVKRGKYVKRNKIISGLSKCLIVAEASQSMGTYHQVDFAIKQGLKVFALRPSNDDAQAYGGFKKFLNMGAIPFSSVDEVVAYLDAPNSSLYESFKPASLLF